MVCQIVLGRAVAITALSFMFAMAPGATGDTPASRPRANVSCFAVAGVVTCYETGFIIVPPIPPAFTSGEDVEGSDEDIVIRDDGGHHVARG